MKYGYRYVAIRAAVLGCALLLTGIAPKAVENDAASIARLDFEGAEIRAVMKTLSEIGGRNIILDSTIEGEVTIFLQDVTWKEAFLAVLKMNDLVAYESNGFIKVLSRANYEARRKQLIEEITTRQAAERLGAPVRVHVMKIENARAQDIKNTLDPLLGDEDQPSVDMRTNSLVFTVTDSSFAVVQEIVRELDTETRQVSIEVKMVTVDADATSEMGINWSALWDNNSVVQNTVGEEGKTLLATLSGSVSNTLLEGNLAALIQKNKADIVSRPHVTTQDNESATISSGQQIPIVTYDDARNTVIELVEASTQLIVTPHILSEDRVLLEVEASRRSAEGVGIGLKINEELANVKMITSDGETAVIGGMRQMHQSRLDSGIPILQNIPLLGQLFKYTNRNTKETDLLVFITPRIVQENAPKLTEK